MTNLELRNKSRRQLKGNRLKFALLTLILICIPVIINYFTNDLYGYGGIILQQIITIVIFTVIAVFTRSFYLNYSRTGNFEIKSGFKNFKCYLRYFAFLVLYYISFMIISMLVVFIFSYMSSITFFENICYGFNYGFNYINPFNGIFWLALVLAIILLIIVVITFLFIMLTTYLIVDGNGVWYSLKTSVTLMKNNKWKLLKLMLSFLGWYLLVIVTFGIAILWVGPYYILTLVNFYLDIIKTDTQL